MSQKSDSIETLSDIAFQLASRIRWERELGVQGYRRQSSKRNDSLADLQGELGDCTRCGLHHKRSNIVFGEGNEHASIVFVGEGPGHDEDVKGRPFVGAAGQLLDRIIAAIGLSRQDVYICNVVKCRPPENRVPTREEQDICGPFLRRQLEIIGPEAVVALGGTAAKYLTGLDEPLGRLRGRFHERGVLRILPTYHPAYILRKPEGKKPVWQDMQMLMRELGLPLP